MKYPIFKTLCSSVRMQSIIQEQFPDSQKPLVFEKFQSILMPKGFKVFLVDDAVDSVQMFEHIENLCELGAVIVCGRSHYDCHYRWEQVDHKVFAERNIHTSVKIELGMV